MKLSDFFPFVPVLAIVGVVFALPSDSNDPNVQEVRSSVAQVTGWVQSLVTGESVEPIVLAQAGRSDAPMAAAYQPRPDTQKKSDTRVTRVWENRPIAHDYANGRATHLSYGESQSGNLRGMGR